MVVEAPDVVLQCAHWASPFVFFYYLFWLTSWATFILLSPTTTWAVLNFMVLDKDMDKESFFCRGVIGGKGRTTGLLGRRLCLEMGGRGAHIQTGHTHTG